MRLGEIKKKSQSQCQIKQQFKYPHVAWVNGIGCMSDLIVIWH